MNVPQAVGDIGKCDHREWADVLGLFEDASLYQSSAYALEMYGRDQVEHVTLKMEGEIVGAAQIGLRRFPGFQTGTANIHWGPLWRRKGRPPDHGNFGRILTGLRDEYASRRKFLLRIWPHEPDGPDPRIKKILIERGFRANRAEDPYRTLRLDITPELEDLRKNFDQKWRNQLNRAEKNSLEVIEGTDDGLYQIFLELQKEMRARKHFVPGVDYETYRRIQSGLAEGQKMRIFVCRSAGAPVAIAMCSAMGDAGIYLLGATGDSGLKLNGSNLLQWRVIQWLKEQGCRYYDLGGVDPEKNPGVYRFKCGIAGKNGREVRLIGQFVFFDSLPARALYWAMNRSGSWRTTLRKWAVRLPPLARKSR